MFVRVNKSGTPSAPVDNSEEVKFLKRLYEKQAMLNIQITPSIILPMLGSTTHDNLCKELRNIHGNTYDNHIKIFLVSGSGTCNTNYNQRSIILRTGRNFETLAHEMGHALGLPHTFTNKEITDRISTTKYRTGEHTDPSANADVTYQGRMTDNIMDYSHMPNEDFTEDAPGSGSSTGKRYTLYYWQMRKIWIQLDLMNFLRERAAGNNPAQPAPLPNEESNEITIGTDRGLAVFESVAKI